MVDADGLAISPSEPVNLALGGPAFEQGPDGGLQMRLQDVHSRVPSLMRGWKVTSCQALTGPEISAL